MIPLTVYYVSFKSLYQYSAWGISHLGLWSLMLLSAYGVGGVFLRKCNFNSAIERVVFTLASGLGLCGLGLFVLGLCGALYAGVIWGLTIAAAAAPVFYFISYLIRGGRGRWFASSLSSSLSSYLAGLTWKEVLRPRRLLVAGVAAVGLAYAGIMLLAAMYPPMHWDAIAGHLVLARQYLIEHRVVALREGAFPLLPALNHMLFTWAMALKDDVLAQLVEYTFLMLTALGLFAWGQRQRQPWLGMAAAALWVSHPLVLWLGESAYVDVGQTCFAFLGVYALRVFWDKREVGWWMSASALFGMAAATKMPALFFVPACVALSLWARLRSWINWRELALGWGVMLLILVPCYGFIAYHTGNPIWPMFPMFTRAEWLLSTEDSFAALTGGGGLPKTFLNVFQVPVYLGLRPDLFFPDGNRDFTSVIALVPLTWIIAIWHRSVRWWALWILAYTAYWFKFASFMRYWLPVLPLVGLALYEGLDWALGKISKSAALHNAVWVVLTVTAIGYGGRVVMKQFDIKGRVPVTVESRRELLMGLSSGYRGVDYINRHAQPGDTACVFDGFYLTYYLQPHVSSMMRTATNPDQASSTMAWPPREKWLDKLEADNTTWILLQHNGLNLREQNPFERPGGPTYELVYSGSSAYVWRRAPLPPDMRAEVARVTAADPCPATAPATSQFEGYHDTASCHLIEGWAWDANRPDCPIKINIYDGDMLLETVPADRLRDDLARLGKGAGKHGFRYSFSHDTVMRFKDGRPHSIRITIAGADVALKNTPISISCPK